MIIIYNESKYPWTVDMREESTVVHFLKSRKIKIKNQVATRSLAIMAYKNVFEHLDECGETLSQAINMKDPYVVCESYTSLIFNKKELNPVINTQGHAKLILMASLVLNKRRVVSVETDNAFVLKSLTVGDELSFVTSFNREGAKMSVHLYNEKLKQIEVITFTTENNTVVKSTETVNASDVKFKLNPSYKIKVFRPRRATSLVLAHPIAIPTVKEVFGNEHTYEEVTSKSFDDVVSTLKSKKYHAVTYATNKTRKEETVVDKKRVNHIIDKLSSCFNVVYKAYADGHIEKVKF